MAGATRLAFTFQFANLIDKKGIGAEMCPAISFWERYWGRAGQLWANLFSLASVTIPEVFAKVYSAQSTSRF